MLTWFEEKRALEGGRKHTRAMVLQKLFPRLFIAMRLNCGCALGRQPESVPSLAGKQIVAKRDLQSGCEPANRIEVPRLGTGLSAKA